MRILLGTWKRQWKHKRVCRIWSFKSNSWSMPKKKKKKDNAETESAHRQVKRMMERGETNNDPLRKERRPACHDSYSHRGKVSNHRSFLERKSTHWRFGYSMARARASVFKGRYSVDQLSKTHLTESSVDVPRIHKIQPRSEREESALPTDASIWKTSCCACPVVLCS